MPTTSRISPATFPAAPAVAAACNFSTRADSSSKPHAWAPPAMSSATRAKTRISPRENAVSSAATCPSISIKNP